MGKFWGSDDSNSVCEGTNWTFIWQFNAAIMMLMGVNYPLMALGAFNFKFRLGSSLLNNFLALLNFIGSITAFSSYNGAGAFCTLKKRMISEYDGDNKFVKGGYTYADDGNTIYLFAVIQIVLGVIQVVVCGCPLYCNKVLPDDEIPEDKAKRSETTR